ncbi:hypothetical protein PVAP13_9KG177800 [Panicum virgatum]|uniref:Uncharacterized protein n=1 Tax=Panicum virgatum TaxID=38727 RepID=A0A8T0NKT9_PANVG|nr:hypothetical protein PVAP13_9KG177800 [Panicum virgatum]
MRCWRAVAIDVCPSAQRDPSLPGAAPMASGLPGSLSTADGDATRLDGSAWPPPSHAKSRPDGDAFLFPKPKGVHSWLALGSCSFPAKNAGRTGMEDAGRR